MEERKTASMSVLIDDYLKNKSLQFRAVSDLTDDKTRELYMCVTILNKKEEELEDLIKLHNSIRESTSLDNDKQSIQLRLDDIMRRKNEILKLLDKLYEIVSADKSK